MTRIALLTWVLLCPTAALAGQPRAAFALRSSAIVHLRPSGKTLSVRIEKRDLNIYEGPDTLSARLLAPDRSVVASVSMPDDGNASRGGGPTRVPQSETMAVAVAYRGVYILHVQLGSGDQVFGMETNCPHYVIESGIFLNDHTLSGQVWFVPPEGRFSISAEAVHKSGIQEIPLVDGTGRTIHTFSLKAVKEPVVFDVGTEAPRPTKPWGFKIARQDVQINIKGVRHWSPDPKSLFPVNKTASMLTPYSVRAFLMPGQTRRVQFVLSNPTARRARMRVSVGSQDAVSCRLVSPASVVDLKAKATVDAVVALAAAPGAELGSSHTCVVEAEYANDPTAVAAAAVKVTIGRSRMNKPLDLPVVLRPYEHENAQFGYLPRYPCNPPFFDLSNRPHIRNRTGDRDWASAIVTLVDGRWVERPFIPAIKAKYPNFTATRRAAGWHGTKTVFDRDGHWYTLIQIRLATRKSLWVLLHSRDRGETYSVYELPEGTPDIAQWSGHNQQAGPPVILLYTFREPHPGKWASVNSLRLIAVSKSGDGLALGKPVLVSDRCFGTCQHSGDPPPYATRGTRTHIAWGEVDDSGAPGVPTYVATYDHTTGKVGPKVFLTHAPPVNDVHNAPGIVQDSKGYLHVITGAHGAPFYYLRSLKPGDVSGGWTKPEPVLRSGYVDEKSGPKGRGRQTYLALLCDSQDTLHIAYRQWRRGVDPYFPRQLFAALSYQRKPAGQPWEDAKPLVVPPFPGYSIYYHKLTLDRRDRLYLSYSYYSKDQSYRDAIPGQYDYRCVITSADGGRTWKLAETEDFLQGMDADQRGR